MSLRSSFAALGLVVIAVGYWMAVAAQSPLSEPPEANPPTQQADPKSNPPKVKKNGKQKQARQSALERSAIVDLPTWPADDTLTVLLSFGLTDREPTPWDGYVEADGVTILRLRPWRFSPEMKIDDENHSWQCGTWLGPTPLERVFDRHLPSRPQPLVRSGVLIDLAGDAALHSTLEVVTAQGRFSVAVNKLLQSGCRKALEGRAQADLAVFGYPVAARTEPHQRVWFDDPALAVGTVTDDVAVSYLAYSQETTGDAIYVRRRLSGRWQTPELVSAPPLDRDRGDRDRGDRDRGDHYRSAVCFDTTGSLWVVYGARVEDNFDLYGRRWKDNRWQPVVRLTSDPQPDLQHVLVADRQGGMWLVWQGFRNGQSDILARHWGGQSWGDEQRVSSSPANDWHPAATSLPRGGIAVVWDSYERGNYDIYCRATDGTGSRWGEPIPVTQTETMEARPTIACDRAGRLWIAYDTAGAYWGKDTGFMLELASFPQGTRLYEGRRVEVTILDEGSGQLLAAGAPPVRPDTLNRTLHEQVEYPQLVHDEEGRMWLVMRRRATLNLSRRGVGRLFGWDVLVSRFDPHSGNWMEPLVVADSLGRLDAPSGIACGGGRLWLAWSHDHREYLNNRPDASSIFAGHLPLAGVAPADAAGARCSTRPTSATALTPPPAHPHEAQDVARLRGYKIESGGKTYRIYRGDMHRHTETSSDGGGDGSMLDAYRYALDAASMDFLLVTDHHDGGREYDWWRREKFNDLFRVGESFTGLFGYERSLGYPNGHRNVFFTRRGTRPLANLPQEGGREPRRTGQFLYPHLRERGGICFSHTSATGMGTDWRDNDPELEPLVEIFQGDRTSYEKLGAPWSAQEGDAGTQEGGFQPLGYVNLALAKGYKLGFQASSDHLSTHLSYSCILAEKNTRESLMEAMKKRHAYAATDNILLDVRANGIDGEHILGDVFACSGPPKLKVKVVGTNRLSDVVVVKDDRVVYSTQPAGNEVSFEFTDAQATRGRESYYYVRVVQSDRQLAWASPMWITSQ